MLPINLRPNYALAYANRGNSELSKGARRAAIADYRAALQVAPNLRQAIDALKQLGIAP